MCPVNATVPITNRWDSARKCCLIREQCWIQRQIRTKQEQLAPIGLSGGDRIAIPFRRRSSPKRQVRENPRERRRCVRLEIRLGPGYQDAMRPYLDLLERILREGAEKEDR